MECIDLHLHHRLRHGKTKLHIPSLRLIGYPTPYVLNIVACIGKFKVCIVRSSFREYEEDHYSNLRNERFDFCSEAN